MNTCIVVPTIREASIQAFLRAWRWPCRVIVVEDNPEPTFQLSGANIAHYAWCDIDRDLGYDAWIIPRRSDCVRSYGYWQAWCQGADLIITLDDDCLPESDVDAPTFLAMHAANLRQDAQPAWHSTLTGTHPRGYPYQQTTRLVDVVLSHGLWTNVPDYDAVTQLVARRQGWSAPVAADGVIPRGSYYPMCGMNLAWRRDVTPLLYFLLMGQDAQGRAYPYDRFGDIWAGIISKRILDHLGLGVWSGGPTVHHARASNVWANLRKEAPGLEANEAFWQWVDGVPLVGEDITGMYRQVAEALAARGGYWLTLARAMHTWGGLYG